VPIINDKSPAKVCMHGLYWSLRLTERPKGVTVLRAQVRVKCHQYQAIIYSRSGILLYNWRYGHSS